MCPLDARLQPDGVNLQLQLPANAPLRASTTARCLELPDQFNEAHTAQNPKRPKRPVSGALKVG